jgi:hypothetical protein
MPTFRRQFDDAIAYFQVGDSKTFNKFEAIKWANGDVSKIHLYFLDDVWDNLDVSVEPKETWSQLMRERCFQLRDQYKTMAIAYSGGYDSQTILDHCIINNIRVDEIVTLTMNYFWDKAKWQQPEGKSGPILAQWYKENVYPNLKISIIDRDVDYLEKIYNQADDGWLFNNNHEIGFLKNHRAMPLEYSNSGARIIDQSHKVILDGHEKPRLVIKDGWWHMAYPDLLLQFSINSPYESFFLSRDMPKLHLKQVHMMINWVESFPLNSINEVHELLSKCHGPAPDNWVYYSWNMAVGRSMVKHWNSFDCFSSGKKGNQPTGMFDTLNKYFFEVHWNTMKSSIQKWNRTASNFIASYPDAFENQQQKTIWTKHYPIKPVELGRVSKSIIL